MKRGKADPSSVRQRVRHYTEDDTILPKYENKRPVNKKQPVLPLPSGYIMAMLAIMVAIYLTVIIIEKKLPPGLKISEEELYPNRFIAERAMNNLINLTKNGPRVAGSYANEVLAVKFLVDEIKTVIKNAEKQHFIEYNVQRSSGAFPLPFLDGMTNVYRDVQNVAVKISSNSHSNFSLLLNCHFDSVSDSPGASDDGSACAVMLELLRVFSLSREPLRNNIIFLFNGAEENIMQASHGFITQHKWAQEIKAFINLEACGAGGREMLFQAGPNNPWILEIYSKKVPYPYASSLAQEVFDSGLIPGDTDYRIFRDFGNASGLDFVWSKNGYVYHTLFDNVAQVPIGALQRTGDNIQALALGMANGIQISDMSQYQAGNLVYFDFLGAFVVHWSEFIANIVNAVILALALYSIYTNMTHASKEMPRNRYLRNAISCALTAMAIWVVVLIVVAMIALGLTLLGRTMSWYTRPFWLVLLYIGPTVCVSFFITMLSANKFQKTIRSPWTLFQIHYDGVLLIWSAVLLIGILLRIRSSFIPMVWVIFVSLGNLVQYKLFPTKRDWKWLAFHMLALLLPFIQSSYLILGAVNLFVPIMGRSGGGNNCELIIAAIVGIIFAWLLSFFAPFITLARNAGRIISIIIGIFLISLSVLILTPAGFPYSGDVTSPSPQRYMLLNTNRTYYDISGNVRASEGGYWLVDLDINSPQSVLNYVPEMRNARLTTEDCEHELYCGLPYLLPVRHFIWKTHWIPGPAPNDPIPTTFSYRVENINNTLVRYHINATGPDHICIMISPFPNVILNSWSLVDGPPLVNGELWQGRPTYFIYYAYVAKPVPLTFDIDFKIPNGYSKSVMDIAVTSHYLHGENQRSDTFNKFLSQFPQWVAINAWSATYSSYRV